MPAPQLAALVAPVGDATVQQLASAEAEFGLELLRATPGDGNVTVSPASLARALAMLEIGGRGRTAAQIARVLHTAGMTATQQGAAWHALGKDWHTATAAGPTLTTADALWAQRGRPVQPSYVRDLRQAFGADLRELDFAGDLDGARKAINSWAAEHTNGRVPQLYAPGALPAQTDLLLTDAVYFLAHWTTPFQASDDQRLPFTRADGTTEPADYMTGERTVPVAITSDYEAVQLPYQGGRFAALVVMPRRSDLSDFAASLNAQSVASIAAALRSQYVALSLPKFTTTSDLDLAKVLATLGMRLPFTDSADFSGIARDQHVDSVVQRTYLKVAEKGTEAAAVTGIGIAAGAVADPPTQLQINRPFLFLVRDTKTGAILFASRIVDPAH